jgi:hypothetical protein
MIGEEEIIWRIILLSNKSYEKKTKMFLLFIREI